MTLNHNQQQLGECHCWWTRVSPKAHVAKFCVRLQLIRSVLRASKFFVLKFIEIVILWIYYMTSLLASASFGTFVTSLFNFLNYFVWLIITDDGSVPEMRIWSILLMKFDIKWSIHLDLFLYFNHFTHLVSVIAGGHESPWGHMQPSSTVDFSWLIRSVSRSSTIFVLKFIEIVIFGVYLPSLLASICFGTFVISLFNFFSYFVWLRITDDGSVLEMGIWSILLSLFSYCKSQAFTLNTLWSFLQNICPNAQSTFFVLAGGGGHL